MKKNIYIILLLLSSIGALAQTEKINKNTFLFGVNYAIHGRNDQVAPLFKFEYNRKISKLLSVGVNMGFFNYSLSEPAQTVPVIVYQQSSITTADIVPYLHIIDTPKHLFRAGIGYSLLNYKNLDWRSARLSIINERTIIQTEYIQTNGLESNILVHLEYAFYFTPNIGLSVNARYYSFEWGLSYLGLNILYSF